MELQTREREGVVIIDGIDRMDGSTDWVETAVDDAIANGQTGVVLNLEAVTYFNSTFLGDIVQQFKKLDKAGGKLKLLNPRRSLMQLLVNTRLSTIFDIFTSEEDAVDSFFPERVLRYPRVMRDDAPSVPKPTESKSRLAVFLCHSSQDKPAVRELHKKLAVAGAKPWLDELDLLPGQVWEREIPAAVRRSDAVMVCLSTSSIGKTGYLQREIKHALDAAEEQSDDSIFIIPSRLESCDVPERLRRWQWVDLFAPDGYDRLLTALQARALALGRSEIRPGTPGRS